MKMRNLAQIQKLRGKRTVETIFDAFLQKALFLVRWKWYNN
jgi:hypothetical protein